MSPQRFARFVSAIAVLAAALGCGTGDYNARLDKRLADLKREAPFATLSAPTEIPDTTVKISIPQQLSRFATLDTEDATSPNGKISPERVKLSVLKLPGVYCVYDSEQSLGDGFKAPVACQIAIIPKSAPEAAGLPAILEAGLKLAFPTQQISWQEVQAATPSGEQTIPWKMIRVEGDLLFDVYPDDPNAAMKFEKMPAIVEAWWHEDPGGHYHTLLVWRCPTKIDEQLKLMEKARLTAGTISVEPPAEEAKPAEGA